MSHYYKVKIFKEILWFPMIVSDGGEITYTAYCVRKGQRERERETEIGKRERELLFGNIYQCCFSMASRFLVSS